MGAFLFVVRCGVWCRLFGVLYLVGSLVTVGFGGFARCLRGLVFLVDVCFIDCCG